MNTEQTSKNIFMYNNLIILIYAKTVIWKDINYAKFSLGVMLWTITGDSLFYWRQRSLLHYEFILVSVLALRHAFQSGADELHCYRRPEIYD